MRVNASILSRYYEELVSRADACFAYLARDQREDAIAEVLALAWAWAHSAARRGRLHRLTPLGEMPQFIDAVQVEPALAELFMTLEDGLTGPQAPQDHGPEQPQLKCVTGFKKRAGHVHGHVRGEMRNDFPLM